MEREVLLDNIRVWQERIGNASLKWGGCEICAVTKTVDTQTINMAKEGGILTIGENRVQELMSKLDTLDSEYTIHIIGSLQTNKVKYIIGKAACIQSLDRDELANEIARRSANAGITTDALVQVNIAREPQKGGIDEDELISFLKRNASLDGLRIKGLMAIMPFTDDPESIRPYFRRMREWFDRLKDDPIPNVSMDILSMGMSGDCIVAAEEGSTMVRLGRALFGARPTKVNL